MKGVDTLGLAPHFGGTGYPRWKVLMEAYLQVKDLDVWRVTDEAMKNGTEMNRISADRNPTLCTSVVVPGGLPRAIPGLRNTKNPYRKKTNRVQHLFITLIKVHLFGTYRVQVQQD
jgi:hypothetical protein